MRLGFTGKEHQALLERPASLLCYVHGGPHALADLPVAPPWLLLAPATARHINMRYPGLRSWAWLRFGIAAEEEEGQHPHRITEYNHFKAFDPFFFYTVGAMDVRSERSTQDFQRIVRPAQASNDEVSDESSESSDSDRSNASRTSASKTVIRKKGNSQKAATRSPVCSRTAHPRRYEGKIQTRLQNPFQ